MTVPSRTKQREHKRKRKERKKRKERSPVFFSPFFFSPSFLVVHTHQPHKQINNHPLTFHFFTPTPFSDTKN